VGLNNKKKIFVGEEEGNSQQQILCYNLSKIVQRLKRNWDFGEKSLTSYMTLQVCDRR